MTPNPLRADLSNHSPAWRWALLLGVCALVAGAVVAGVFWPRRAGPAPRAEVNVQLIRDEVAAFQADHRLPEAEQAVRRWREGRPDDLEAHLRLVDISLRSDRLAGAVEGARSALRLKPRSGRGWRSRRAGSGRRGGWSAAAATCRRATGSCWWAWGPRGRRTG